MDELTIGDKTYISSKQAAKITGYAKDYVGQLCREGRVEARLVGRNWYVLEASVLEHRFGAVEEEQQKPVAVQEAKESIPWTKPSYVAEEPEPVVPVLVKSPDTQSAKQVVSEMQSAWQEWFAAQPTVEAQERKQAATEEKETIPLEEDIEEEPVHISRVTEDTEEPAYAQSVSPIIRDYYTEATPDTHTEDAVEAPESSGRAHSLLRALFILVAVIAVGVAVVGSGLVGDLLAQEYALTGWSKGALQYLGGEWEFNNAK